MSVPSGRRGESDLLVHQKADELAKYTLHITENEKVSTRDRRCFSA